MKEELAAGLSKRQIAERVEHDEVHAGEVIGEPSLPAGAGLALQPVHQVEDDVEAASCATADARSCDGHDEMRGEEWLLIEWPEGDAEPAKYWLATVPPDMPFHRLVDLAKLRWRIERDYQELKQELGRDTTRDAAGAASHHATLCIAAYAFLIAERARIPPSAAGDAADQFATLGVSQNCKPLGAARPPRTTCCQLDCDDAPTSDRRPRWPC